MIFVRDKGRMANNILQYAHLLAWGLENNRSTLSMRFAYKYPWFNISHTPKHNFFSYLCGKWGAASRLLPVADFDAAGADPKLLEAKIRQHRNIVVQGWNVRFYDLFEKHFDAILKEFSFLPPVLENAKKAVGKNLPSDADTFRIGLHIRRGDYSRWQNGRYLFSDEQYLTVAVSLAKYFRTLLDNHSEQKKQIMMVICGNDPALNRQKFEETLSRYNINTVFPDGNPAEDLCALSLCDALAGPPSTFSLVASMYHNLPLYRIENPAAEITPESFGTFFNLFRSII